MPNITHEVANYIVTKDYDMWPEEAVEKIKIHIFDTLLAILSGQELPAGQRALDYLNAYGESPKHSAYILGTSRRSSPELAAMINGVFAHSDETDDTSETARMHPGASIIPAAFAIADHLGCSGKEFLNAVLVGYQVGIAFPQTVWAEGKARMHSSRATHNVGQIMGAVAAAGSLLGLSTSQMCYALSYAAQQTSGINSLYRERQHVEKAYVFGGMPAEQGVRAALFASLGFTGVTDVLDTSINFFDSFEGRSDPDLLVRELANEQGGVFQADIKLYPVGLPIQAAAQAMDEILSTHSFGVADIARVACHLPSQKAYIVDDRDMPPICLQYILATMLEDGGLTFYNSHDQQRLDRNRHNGLMSRIELVHSEALNPSDDRGSRNRAHISIEMKSGKLISAKVDELKGTCFSPAQWGDMRKKAGDIFGNSKNDAICSLIDLIGSFEDFKFSDPQRYNYLNGFL